MHNRPAKRWRLAIAMMTLLAGGSVAWAQNVPNPAFVFEKPPEKPADWKVQAKGGALLTTGNGQSKVGTFAVDGFRQSGANKLSAARSSAARSRSRMAPRGWTRSRTPGSSARRG